MKYFIFSLTLLLATLNGRSQDILLDPDSIHVSKPDSLANFEIVAHSYVYNQTADTLQMRWERVVNEYDEAWEGTAICDKNQCWTPTVSTKPFELAPGDSGAMDVHFYHNDLPGEGAVEIIIYVEDDSANTVVNGLYSSEITATSTTNISISSKPDYKIYPNPCRDYFYLQQPADQKVNSSIRMFNMLGEEVVRFMPSRARYTLPDHLPAGQYIIQLRGAHSNVHRSLKLTKLD